MGKLTARSILLFCILFLAYLFFTNINVAFAQQCSSTFGRTDFQSLRPYPFEPCNPNAEDLTPYCANSIIAWDSITRYYHINDYRGYENAPCIYLGVLPDCMCHGPGINLDNCCSQVHGADGHWNGLLRCKFTVNGQRDISASFEDAKLPIMGNTIDVTHNPNYPDLGPTPANEAVFSSAAKVNEYVSWYLNGVIGRAEYPYPDMTKTNSVTSMENPDDVDKIVNFSGPIKKLLPFSIQNQDRIKQIDNLATNTVRHDQIVACTHLVFSTTITLPFIGKVTFPNLNLSAPGRCYGSIFDNKRLLSNWEGHEPPIEEDGQYLYQSQIDFLKAYTKWRGLYCFFVPVFGQTLWACIDNPGSADFWANLFPYVPFSSTEDRLGEVDIKSVNVSGSSPDFNIIYANVTVTPAPLYFPHMQESTELATLLQNTYASKDINLKGQVSKVYNSSNPYCDLTEVRSNPGDPISNPKNPATLTAHVDYKAEVYCNFYAGTGNFNGAFCQASTSANPPGLGGQCLTININNPLLCEHYYSKLDCNSGTCAINCQPVSEPSIQGCSDWGASLGYTTKCMPASWNCTFLEDLVGEDIPFAPCNNWPNVKCAITSTCSNAPSYESNPVQQCTKTLNVNIQPETETPLADEVWSQLVAGPAGVFKRIFPEVGSGTPVEAIWDIPGSSTYTFTCSGGNCTVGSPGGNRPINELYFPHIGGVYEYFLRAIQTALRPKGFGNPILSGEQGQTPPGSICPTVADSEIPGKYLGQFKANVIDLANRWNSQCPGPDNNLADECYNYVVKTSIDGGVNPAFSLTIWLNESGASNYCVGGSTTQDFGYNNSSYYQNLTGQLDRFLQLPNSYNSCSQQGVWGGNRMLAFMTMFQTGDCLVSTWGTGYYNDVRNTTWQWVTGDCVNGDRYAISWPTDSSCP